MLGLDAAAEGAVAEQRLERAVDLLVEVDRARAARAARGRRSKPSARPGTSSRDLLDLRGVGEAEPDRPSARRGRGRPGRCWCSRRRGIGKTSSITPRTSGSLSTRRAGAAVAREQRVAERVQGPRPRRERLEARLELVLGELVVGDGDHRLAPVAAVGEQVAHPLGQHAGLPRARRGDHPDRPAVVGDRGELVGRQLPPRTPAGSRGTGVEEAGVDRPRRRSRGSASAATLQRGPPSIQASRAVGRTTSAAPPCGGAGARPPSPPTTRPARRPGRRSCSPRPGAWRRSQRQVEARGERRRARRRSEAGSRNSPGRPRARRRRAGARPSAGAGARPPRPGDAERRRRRSRPARRPAHGAGRRRPRRGR